MSTSNLYAVLNIDSKADEKSIRQAYYQLAHLYHPDKNQGSKEAEEHFKRIKSAYEILIDPKQRKAYDEKHSLKFEFGGSKEDITHRFEVSLDKEHCSYGEELELSFFYTGEGRYFKKPELQGFEISGKPYVNFQQVQVDGQVVKRTQLKYIIAPIETGILEIGQAFIRIHEKLFQTKPIHLNVYSNACHYLQGHESDGKPEKVHLHYKNIIKRNAQTLTEWQNHSIIIPRSAKAEMLHDHGRMIKLAFSLLGFVLAEYTGQHSLLGMLVGNIVGGLATTLYYSLHQCKNRWRDFSRNKTVEHYRNLDYRYGKQTGSGFLNHSFVYFLKRSFL
ncbi:MAG TPA: DnaJ domain-containing protein [Bacteroidia bacterium]|nr:DnaJ domain-containing protein [Bacteroidia bacterium]